jgi:DNA-binding NarL/FixJ family response regulator
MELLRAGYWTIFQEHRQKRSLDKYNPTHREKEILEYLVNGLSYKEIASVCNITFQTLNSHTKNIYLKLNVHSRAEVAAMFRNPNFG